MGYFRGGSKSPRLSENQFYNLVREGKNGFYTEVDKENPAVNYSNDATYLATLQNDLLVLKVNAKDAELPF